MWATQGKCLCFVVFQAPRTVPGTEVYLFNHCTFNQFKCLILCWDLSSLLWLRLPPKVDVDSYLLPCSKDLFKFLFSVRECLLACIYVCHMHTWCLESGRGCPSLRNWSPRQLWAALWVLGIEPCLSARTVSALNCWAVFSTSLSIYLFILFNFICIVCMTVWGCWIRDSCERPCGYWELNQVLSKSSQCS